MDLAALAANTSSQYTMYWQLVVEFAEDHELNYILTGKNPKKDEEFLLKYVAYEYQIHGNSHSTIKGKLCALRWCTMSMGYPDPLADRPRLDRRLKGIMRLRGGRNPKKPVTVSMLRLVKKELTALAIEGDLEALGVLTGIITSYFFLLRISEYAGEDNTKMSETILKMHHVKFYRNGKECKWSEDPDEVSINIPGSKTDTRKDGCQRNHFISGDELCVVKMLVTWFCATEGLKEPDAPLFEIPNKTGKKMVTRTAVSNCLKATAVMMGLPGSDYATHSCRIGSATSLLHAGADPHAIRLLGRWSKSSDCWTLYSRYSSHLMKGVARDMVSVETAGTANRESVTKTPSQPFSPQRNKSPGQLGRGLKGLKLNLTA